MTFLEEKLLEVFRACTDEQKFAVLEIAKIISTPVTVREDQPPQQQTSAPAEKKVYHGDMARIAQRAVVPPRYQMTTHDLDDLYIIAKREHDPFNAFCFAFDYGFVKGCRAAHRGLVKKGI